MTDVTTLLPPNATPVERAVEQATARVGAVPTPVGDIWTPAAVPSAFIPWLAWAVSVDSWDTSWSDDVKRAVIAASPAVHRRKGTAAAVKSAVAAFGAAVTVTPWFEQSPAGEPYTFVVALDLLASTPDQTTAAAADALILAVDAAKAERDHWVLQQSLAARSDVGAMGFGRCASYARLETAVAGVG